MHGGVTKAKAQRIHAKRRALQREAVLLTRADMRLMVQQIQAGKATFVRRQSLRVTLWDVAFRDHPVPMRVVYDKLRKNIVTILPREEAPRSLGSDT